MSILTIFLSHEKELKGDVIQWFIQKEKRMHPLYLAPYIDYQLPNL